MAIAAASKNDAIASLPADVGHDLVHTLGIIFIPKDVGEFFPSLQYDILIVLIHMYSSRKGENGFLGEKYLEDLPSVSFGVWTIVSKHLM